MQKEKTNHIQISKIVDAHVNHLSNSKKKVYLKGGLLPNLIQFATAEFKKDDSVEPHEHQTMTEVFYVEYGKMAVTLNNESFLATTGDVVVAKVKIIHSFRFLENTKLVYFGLVDNT